MVAIKNTIVGLVMAALATSVAADKCKANGHIGRGAVISSGFSVERGGDIICTFDGELKTGGLPTGNENVIEKCDDLKYPVSFHADAPNLTFKSCQVDFGEDRGIEGKTDNHSHASGCEVEFDC